MNLQRALSRGKVPKGAVIKPRPTKSRKTELIVRLEVESLHATLTECKVTVFNAGNTASYSARVNVYRQPLIYNFNTIPALTLVGSVPISVGALERKEVTVGTRFSSPYFSSYYAVAFDPLEDPFPVNRIDEMTWQERDLLHHDILVWRQFAHKDSDTYFGNAGLVEVADDRRSWTLRPRADHAGDVPDNPRIRRIYFPATPPSMSATRTGDRSELRQEVYLDDLPNGSLALEEASKGNIVATASCELFNYDQTPRDRGTLAIALDFVDGESASTVGQQPERPEGQAYSQWTSVSASAGKNSRFNRLSVRLLAERRKGTISHSYFGNVACTLKHRQVKRAGSLDSLHLRFDRLDS
jgi:hypothetical protein